MKPVLPEPFVRQAGAGPTVVCLHSNASSSVQWRGLMEQLAPSFRVLAPDSYGAGKSPEWPSDSTISLDDEVRLLQPVISKGPDKLVLIGHSYGAAVAMMTALRYLERVRALIVYEPTLFMLEEVAVAPPNGVDGIRSALDFAGQALDAGTWTPLPAISSISGWAAAVGLRHLMSASLPFQSPSSMCAAGATPS